MSSAIKRCKNCVAGADFDLWTVNQIWSPVPCEKSTCDAHKTQCERAKLAGSVYRLWLCFIIFYYDIIISWREKNTVSLILVFIIKKSLIVCFETYIIHILTGWSYLKQIAMHLLLEWE